MRKAKEVIFKILLVIFSAIIVAFFSEGILILLDYNYTPLQIKVHKKSDWRFYHAFEDYNFVYDPDLIWRPRENFSVFNSQGFRGGELAKEKSDQEFRIFALGDSNTLGWSSGKVSDFVLNWSSYLEELLLKIYPHLSVTNAGVYGYTSYQGLQRLKKIISFKPDLVLVSFGANDGHLVTFSDAEFSRSKIRQLEIDKKLLKYKTGQLLLALHDIFLTKMGKELVPRVSLKEYKENLEEMIHLSEVNNFKIIFLTRPFHGKPPDQFNWMNFTPKYNTSTIEIAKKNNIQFIDLYSYFEDKGDLFYDGTHFNEKGNREASKIIYEYLIELYIKNLNLQPN